MKRFYEAYPSKAHPMGILASLISAMATFYPNSQDPNREGEAVNRTIIRLLAKIPTLSAWAYKNSVGHPVVYPRNSLSYVENFVNMMFSLPTEDYEPDPVVVSAMDKLLILHADHEQNCSAAAVRILQVPRAVASIQLSQLVSLRCGVPYTEVLTKQLLKCLMQFMRMVADQISGLKKPKTRMTLSLMGFGHRVYKNFDPRAKIIKKACDEVLSALGVSDPVLDIARHLEEVALRDDYFVQRNLYPNVDFYSGIIYRALGIPTDMFTVMFALGRLPVWIAQWKEMIANKEPIGRPRQIYTGAPSRPYVTLEER